MDDGGWTTDDRRRTTEEGSRGNLPSRLPAHRLDSGYLTKYESPSDTRSPLRTTVPPDAPVWSYPNSKRAPRCSVVGIMYPIPAPRSNAVNDVPEPLAPSNPTNGRKYAP